MSGRGAAFGVTPTRGFAASAKASDADASDEDAGAARARDGDASTSTSSSTTSSSGASRDESDANERALLRERALRAALKRVDEHGWSEAAIDAGLRDLKLSPAMRSCVRSDARAKAPADELAGELVLYFEEALDAAFQAKVVGERERLRSMTSSERVKWMIQTRLEMIGARIDSWHRALAALATPTYALASLRRRAAFADFVADAAGVDAVDILPSALEPFQWHAERATIITLYTATELHLMTDSSKNNRRTWAFLSSKADAVAESRVAALELKSYIDVLSRDAALPRAFTRLFGSSSRRLDDIVAVAAPFADAFRALVKRAPRRV